MCVNSASTVLRGAADNLSMVEILWHRRETRRQTENTNIDLQLGEDAVYSTNSSNFGCISEAMLYNGDPRVIHLGD